jgi:hypothetical protein
VYVFAAFRFHRSLLLFSCRVLLLALLLVGRGTAATPAAEPLLHGKVLETMRAADYTYVRVARESGQLWAAGPHTAVKVGDTVSFGPGIEMKDFRSKTLDRTFDSIQFVDRIIVSDGSAASASILPAPAHGDAPDAAPPAQHGSAHGGVKPAPAADVDVSGIAKAAGGKTVGEIFDARTVLVGKEVVVRGKVVKSNPGVMGRNWLHVGDGSRGADGANDLTVTTKDTAVIGDTVLVRGTVTTNKDFGFGYRYDVMLEEAKITVE